MDQIKNMIEQFNLDNVKYKIESQIRLLKYNRILMICIHVINALSIILSVLSETIQDKIIYAVIVCNICNSVINYEILNCHKKIQGNSIFINNFLKLDNREIYTPDNLYMHRCNNTPENFLYV